MTVLQTMALAVGLLVGAAAAQAGATFDAVKAKGEVACGVTQGLPGFSSPDAKGDWRGIDADFCRAVAAAVLGDAAKVKFVPLSSKQRFTALQSGEVDILSRVTTWTLSRDAGLGVHFAGVIYYDGQGFMVPKAIGVASAKELDGASVCMNSGTTTELNIADFFRATGKRYTPVVFEKSDEALAAYVSGRCDVYTTDQSGLYAQRVKIADPAAHIVLPEVISKEPLGPLVRQGDDEWFNIVKWTLFALIDAEELGVNSTNAAAIGATTANPDVQRLVGRTGDLGKMLGVADNWAAKAVAAVGNYGEMFDRNLGAGSALKIERGLNRLWTQGGLVYAPPVR